MPTAKRRALSAAGRAAIVRAAKKRWGKASRGGGDRTIRPVGNTQLVHSTYRENRNNRTNRMSEVHGGDTAISLLPCSLLIAASQDHWHTRTS